MMEDRNTVSGTYLRRCVIKSSIGWHPHQAAFAKEMVPGEKVTIQPRALAAKQRTQPAWPLSS